LRIELNGTFTQGDIAEVLNNRARGVWVMLDMPNQKGALAKLAGKIVELGRSIVCAEHQLQFISSQ
jgi:hypothetical protein